MGWIYNFMAHKENTQENDSFMFNKQNIQHNQNKKSFIHIAARTIQVYYKLSFTLLFEW